MKLREVIEELQLKYIPCIQYYTDFNGEVIWMGSCHYNNGSLISDDGDDYSLDDEIDSFDFDRSYINGMFILSVYYQSSWYTSEGELEHNEDHTPLGIFANLVNNKEEPAI